MSRYDTFFFLFTIFTFVCGDTELSQNTLTQSIQWRNTTESPQSVFNAYWNVPSASCDGQFGIPLHLDRYNIIANTGLNKTGDAVVIFGYCQLGLYPHYSQKSGLPKNGGLPQLGNLSAHLAKAAADISNVIPDPHFDGIGIIDWEYWRPQWAQNFDSLKIYRDNSVNLVRKNHPELDNATIEILAKIEFEGAAQGYFQSTLRLAKEMRPNAKWGYYHFPYCHNRLKKSGQCNPDIVATNNDITWLFEESTVLYPSIYLRGFEKYQKQVVEGKINEALRVRKLIGKPNLPILAYTRFNYSHSIYYYSKEDLRMTVLQSAELGLDGVVFWGDHNDTNTRQSCLDLQSYINNALGPITAAVQTAANQCSTNQCNGHGRCLGDIMACAGTLKRSRNKFAPNVSGGCTCTCFSGWSGEHCKLNSTLSDLYNLA